ncbi:MAG: hypothetical protein LUE86_05765 [Clostridiales bacterium]|nr:hypothetical protein [Clostridiales bacterium]
MAATEKNIASCQVELIHRNDGLNRALRDTLGKFREVCKMIADIAEDRWPETCEYTSTQEQLTFKEEEQNGTDFYHKICM